MRLLTQVLICLVAGQLFLFSEATKGYKNRGHKETDCEHGHVYPDPENCSIYYQCSNGYLIKFLCPDGLYFDPIGLICNHPELVDCGNPTGGTTFSTTLPTTTTSSTLPTTTTTLPTTTTTPPDSCSPGTFYPDPEDCSIYYQCSNGHLIKFQCPGGLYWDPIGLRCDHPELVDCGNPTGRTTFSTTLATTTTQPTTTTTFLTTTTTLPTTTTTQPTTTTTLPTTTTTLPTTTTTQPTTTTTLPTTTTTLPTTTTTQPTTTTTLPTTTTRPPGFCSSRTCGAYAHPSYTDRFYLCAVNNSPNDVIHLCKAGNSFLASAKGCRQTPTFCSTRACGIYPYPSSSSYFYLCLNTQSNYPDILHACKAGKTFNTSIKGCR